MTAAARTWWRMMPSMVGAMADSGLHLQVAEADGRWVVVEVGLSEPDVALTPGQPVPDHTHRVLGRHRSLEEAIASHPGVRWTVIAQLVLRRPWGVVLCTPSGVRWSVAASVVLGDEHGHHVIAVDVELEEALRRAEDWQPAEDFVACDCDAEFEDA